jgi:NAD-specific glutamate dehydrogenase
MRLGRSVRDFVDRTRDTFTLESARFLKYIAKCFTCGVDTVVLTFLWGDIIKQFFHVLIFVPMEVVTGRFKTYKRKRLDYRSTKHPTRILVTTKNVQNTQVHDN